MGYVMKAISKALVVLGAALVVAVGVSRRTSAANGGCRDVKGDVSTAFSAGPCGSMTGLCTTGTITHAGKLSGTTAYDLNGLAGSADPAVSSYTGALVVTTNHGTLYITDNGVVDFGGGVFTEFQTVTGGTGIFSGATGTTFVSGHLTPDGSGFNGKLSGQVCLANNADLN